MNSFWIEKFQPKYAVPIKERISALKVRQTQILDQIDQLERQPLDVGSPSDDLYRLQQDYNLLIDEEKNLTRQTFPDPLEAFPPELWPGVLPEDAGEILELTAVSRRWCQALLSTPTLWTTVIFDERQADYMAKATTCLHLSRPAGIDLYLRIRFEQWETLASIILPEAVRIRSLSIEIRGREHQSQDPGSVSECLRILSCFEELPALQTLIIPFTNYSFPPVSGFSDPTALPLFRRAPLLLDAVRFSFSPQTLLDPAFRRLERVQTILFDEGTVEILSQLLNLKYLHVIEAEFDVRDVRNPQGGRCVAPLSSITQFKYHGPSALPILKFIGDYLTHLEATIDAFDLMGLLESLGRFRLLTHLTLVVYFSRRKQGSNHSQTPVPSFSPVRTLFLEFWGLSILTGNRPSERDFHMEKEVEACSVAFRSMIFTIPLVEAVNIGGQFPADAAIRYIRSLRNLRSLSISAHAVNHTIDWLPYILPADYLDKLQTDSLRHLYISSDYPRLLFRHFLEHNYDERVLHARQYTISSTPLPSVLSLNVSIQRHLLLDFHTFPNLRTIRLTGPWSSSLTMQMSGFFEELLLLPNQWPSLEDIGIYGDYMEWDILILMLERRNFVAGSSVSRIKTLNIHSTISYNLLYPITQLLNGKFPERPSLSEFSIEEIGRRLCNPNMTGCHRCIRVLRPCESPINGIDDGDDRSLFDNEPFAWEYELPHELPHERIRPDPPLSLDTAKWLSGKRARRLRFVEMVEAARTEIKRSSHCCHDLGRYDTTLVARYSMDGVKFEV